MIKILCVGKIKEKYLEDLIFDYVKRISKYKRIEIVELKDNIKHEVELKSLEERINVKDYNILLDKDGVMLTSEKLATKLEDIWQTNSNITFIIGPSLGVNERIRTKVNFILSFSSLTFPHGLFRGILLEQIYRAMKINNNETYHK